MLRGSILAEFRAQRGQDIGGTGELGVAAFQPLEFSQKIAPREGCQSLQKLVDLIGRHRCNWCSAIPEVPSGVPWGRLKVVDIKPRNSWHQLKKSMPRPRGNTGVRIYAAAAV